MNWQLPAKTFLLGEYSAVAGESALLFASAPCFSLRLNDTGELQGIHPESPAGLWWQQQQFSQGLCFEDPYHGKGGLGASSAQFVGAFLAACALHGLDFDHNALLKAYDGIWSGKGLRPSGYDVLTQAGKPGCVFINRNQNILQHIEWPFKELSPLLIHTGNKLATHSHLLTARLPDNVSELSALAESGKAALENCDDGLFIDSIHAFQKALAKQNLSTENTLKHLQLFQKDTDILAAKGCGALGADVILLLVATKNLLRKKAEMQQDGWFVI